MFSTEELGLENFHESLAVAASFCSRLEIIWFNCNSWCHGEELKLILEYELVNLKVFSSAYRLSTTHGGGLILLYLKQYQTKKPLRSKGLNL